MQDVSIFGFHSISNCPTIQRRQPNKIILKRIIFSSLDSVCACHNPFERSILCSRLQLSKSVAGDGHFTKLNYAITIFGLLLPCLYEIKTTKSQIQLNDPCQLNERRRKRKRKHKQNRIQYLPIAL